VALRVTLSSGASRISLLRAVSGFFNKKRLAAFFSFARKKM
jgi:hypothetical protein